MYKYRNIYIYTVYISCYLTCYILFVIDYCYFELRIQIYTQIRYHSRFYSLKGKCWDFRSERLLEGSLVISA